jgi:hypothetical protein
VNLRGYVQKWAHYIVVVGWEGVYFAIVEKIGHLIFDLANFFSLMCVCMCVYNFKN